MNGAAAGVRLGLAVSRIGSKVREESLARTMPAIAERATRIVEARADKSARAMLGTLDTWLQTYASESPLPPAVGNLLSGFLRQGGLAFAQVISTAIGFGVGNALGAVLEPAFTGMAQSAWKDNPVQVLALGELAEEIARGFAGIDDRETEAARQGFDRSRLRRAVQLATARVPLGEVLELLNRGELDEAGAREHLQLLGFPDPVTTKLLELRRRVPPATDVVRFAVREVYNRPLAEQLGYTEEFGELSGDVIRDAEAAGVTREDLFKYWIAHWELPSPSQAYAMLHRGLITESDLGALLKASDYPLPWRERLQQIAYLLPGRIDLRRMYAAGVIDKAEVMRGYLSLGYDPTNAARLTEFAVTEAMDEDRALAKGEVLALYEDGHVPEAEAAAMLGGLGYDDDAVAFLLTLADYRRVRRYRERAIGTVRTRYVARKLDEDAAQRTMDQLGLDARARDELLSLWDLEREAVTADLTEAQMRAAWRAGVVTEEVYVGWLTDHGYTTDEAAILVGTYRPAAE